MHLSWPAPADQDLAPPATVATTRRPALRCPRACLTFDCFSRTLTVIRPDDPEPPAQPGRPGDGAPSPATGPNGPGDGSHGENGSPAGATPDGSASTSSARFGTLSLATRRARVRHRTVALVLRCAGRSGARCDGALRIRRGDLHTRALPFTVFAGHVRVLRLAVPLRLARRLSAHGLIVTAKARWLGPHGVLATRRRLTLLPAAR